MKKNPWNSVKIKGNAFKTYHFPLPNWQERSSLHCLFLPYISWYIWSRRAQQLAELLPEPPLSLAEDRLRETEQSPEVLMPVSAVSLVYMSQLARISAVSLCHLKIQKLLNLKIIYFNNIFVKNYAISFIFNDKTN